MNARLNPGKAACPCCGYRTIKKRGNDEICPVCYWQDDGQGNEDAGEVRGGPNGELSLVQARRNYEEFGACEKRFASYVRLPGPDEGKVGA